MNIKPGKNRCGFCTTNHHGSCPGGVMNGSGEEVITCACDCERAGTPRCLDCNRRGEDINPNTWRCVDPDDCRAFIEKRLQADPIIQQIRAIRADLADSNRPGAKLRTPRPPSNRVTTGKCLHCGEATKGGLFLPGHDSAHVSNAVRDIRTGQTTLQETIDSWSALGISEALQGKLQKRATK